MIRALSKSTTAIYRFYIDILADARLDRRRDLRAPTAGKDKPDEAETLIRNGGRMFSA